MKSAASLLAACTVTSHSVWSAWIEITTHCLYYIGITQSHSVWSAWIEILPSRLRLFLVVLSRTLYGVRGLKYQPISHNLIVVIRRTLYGVRGLKSLFVGIEPSWNRSHSVWSAWIEIATLLAILTAISVALCMECVD